jgi:hypothetical protein
MINTLIIGVFFMADTNQPIPVIVTIKKIVKLARKKKKTK